MLRFSKQELNPQVDGLKVNRISPNPFSEEAVIAFSIEEDAEVSFQFSDLAGRQLYERHQIFLRGNNEIKINTGNLQNYSGVIIMTVTSKWNRITRKLTLIR